MGIKPVPTKIFIQFLKSLGIIYVRTHASHDIFDNPEKPLPRPVVIRMQKKEIPLLHIHTTLETIGISKKEFENWLKKK
jgi:predicted RNA binding protein YcfA (HicA-like mRNA interferase family)